MSGDGSRRVRLTESLGNDTHPAWSRYRLADTGHLPPLIAFESDRDGNHEIYRMNADGTGEVRLTHSEADDITPTWSPDDQQIAFVSNRSGRYQLWTMNQDGSGPTQLTRGGRPKFNPSWRAFSNGSELVAFDSPRRGSDYEIYSLRLGGTGITRRSWSLADDSEPTWRADGRGIVFESNRDGNREIYTIDPVSAQVRLTISLSDDVSPDWLSGDQANQIEVPPKVSTGSSITCTLTGTNGPDRLVGSSGPNVICGRGGNDSLAGLGGRDILAGGTGRDRIRGGPGRDSIIARDGMRDRVRGGSGSDYGQIDRARDIVTGVEALD
jgi:Ca2+-binding RTX toxin-like protein